ncbi:branched-chain amino acid ABC transporter permease [Nitriliruptor alkaliphilus]|uniref:branched-chain amino acid ABC transporter permease n=1 Tax=Nitriliruptor alkaliphilus TaxID=427918 RepID=UPI0006981D60|nr:branched-chain amino acid ABC transporter permease [Nitriliruptor alkaliphilus]
MGELLGHTLNGLSFGALLFLLASGLTLTFGLMRTVNLAHGAFYAIGGYVALDVLRRTDRYWLAMAVGIVAATVIGVAFERLALHRVLNKELPQIIITVGFAFLVADQILAYYGGRPMSPPRPPGLDGVLRLENFAFPHFRMALIVVALAVFAGLQLLLTRTKVGAMVRASVDDEWIARSVGIRVPLIFVTVFGIGTALAAFAGVWGGAFTGLAPGGEWEILLLALVVVVVGGLGSVPGALLAALAVGLLDEFGKWLFPTYALFTVYAPVVLLLAMRPRGFLGKKEFA